MGVCVIVSVCPRYLNSPHLTSWICVVCDLFLFFYPPPTPCFSSSCHSVRSDFTSSLAEAGVLKLGVGLSGNVDYLAPECVGGRGAGPASDAFSLGSLILQVCTRVAAFPWIDIWVRTGDVCTWTGLVACVD